MSTRQMSPSYTDRLRAAATFMFIDLGRNCPDLDSYQIGFQLAGRLFMIAPDLLSSLFTDMDRLNGIDPADLGQKTVARLAAIMAGEEP